MRVTFFLLGLLLCQAAVFAQNDHPLKAVFEKDDLVSFIKADKADIPDQRWFQHSLNHGAEMICAYLIDEGADVNGHFEGGATPLITAVNSRQVGIVKLLLAKGADPDLKTKGGLEATALMYASARNDLELPQMLVAAGAEVNTIDLNGDPAMNWATYYGNTLVMQWLIDQGADLSIKSKHGMPVDVGLRLWHADSVLEVFRVNWQGEKLTRAAQRLYEAVQANELKTASKLLKSAAEANTTDVLGTPLLQLAVQANNIEMTRLLLEKGADPNHTNRVGMAPLAFAARFDNAECLRLLLQAGANPNQTSEDYRLTPLMGAAVSGNIGIAQQLVAAGANLDIRDVVNDCAALHWAMFYNHSEFELWMLEKGAEFEKSVMAGAYTTRSMAELLNHEVIVDWIDSKLMVNNDLKGSWVIKGIDYIQADTTLNIVPASKGRFSFTNEQYHLIYNPWTNERKPFANLSEPSEQEIKQAFQTLVFNSGSYTFTDSTVVATPDIARVPGFEGGKQYYRYKRIDNELHLTMYDETYPDGTKPDWYQKLQVLFKLVKE